MTHLFGVHCQKISKSKIVPLWRDIRPFEKISCKTPLEIELVIYILECLINNSILCASWQKKSISQKWRINSIMIPIQHTYQYLGLVIHQFRSTSEDSWWKSHLARPILWFQHLQNQFQLLKRLESATLSIWGGLCHISLSMHSIKV